MLMLFRKALRGKNIDFVAQAVTGIERDGNRVTAVMLDNGDRLEAGTIINAAGPSAGKVAAMAGLALPVEPRKRSVFVFEASEKFADMPLLVDPSGIYVRPEGSVYITGGAEPEETDGPADPADFDPDWPLFEEVIWPVLATRIPAFEAIKPTRAWAGTLRLQHARPERRHRPASGGRQFHLRQRVFRPRPAAGAGGRQGDRRAAGPWRLQDDRLLGLRLCAHRRKQAVPRTQRDLRADKRSEVKNLAEQRLFLLVGPVLLLGR